MATSESEALHLSAINHWKTGDAEGALRLLQMAIDLEPNIAAYHLTMGVILKDLGLLDERIACYRRAVQLTPDDPINRANLAAALNAKGDYTRAEAEARIALQLAPYRSETWINLGNALSGQARWANAAAAFDKASEHKPGWFPALQAAAQTHHRAGNLAISAQRYRQLLLSTSDKVSGATSDTNIHTIWLALGDVLFAMREYAEAETCYRQTLQHIPNDASLLTNLGNTLKAQGKIDEASVFYRRVIQITPQLPAPHCNLGTIAQALGRYDEAINCYRKTLELDPALAPVWGNLGNCLSYSPNHGPAEVLEAFSNFNREIAAPLLDGRPHANPRQPERPLRVGYLSPDFRRHAVAYFALPLLEGHNPAQVEVVCYYNHRQQDDWTLRFKATTRQWVDCIDLDDAALAERIRADGIDILVDLAGHTEGNRLPVFARKPAPIQVTWLGYVTTTGLTAIDYRLTHADADPPGSEKYYSERLWRLPGTMWCYRPLPNMPEIAPPPCHRNGFVTFGSFNRFSKISPRVLDCWGRILSSVPESRLIMCLPEGRIRQEVAAFFAERGVAPNRLSAYSTLRHEDFWALHGQVDIALDPYPFNGGTTSCETLWLGVPIITCTGISDNDDTQSEETPVFLARFSSRMGYAFLNSLGLSELAAKNEHAYVELAIKLARDTSRLEQLRHTLRERMTCAPLTDEKRFVREVEAAYRSMWQEWCFR